MYAAAQRASPEDRAAAMQATRKWEEDLMAALGQKTAAISMTPQPHQEELADRISAPESMGQLALHGTGSGKTLSAINAADRTNLPLMAVVPAALRNNMHKEIAKAQFGLPSEVMSYQEALKQMKDPAFLDRASNSLVAIDEGHLTAGEDSARRDLLKFLPAQKKLIMTGTPIRNHPSEVAPIINAVKPGALPEDKRLFDLMYTRTDAQGNKVPVNLRDFAKAIHGTTHSYFAKNSADFPSFEEKIVEVPMSHRQQAAYDYVTGQYPTVAYKMRHGLPADIDEDKDFQAFMSGPRQVVNHPKAYHSEATDEDATKIQMAADEIHARYQKDPNYRGVAYSSFLDAGIRPMQRALALRNIPHHVFTGEQTDNERKQIIDDYNTGRVPVLLISGAGAAGLDLKGTKHIAVLEPHWNEELIQQVKGRGVRYKSHAHLPEEERHVEIQRFHSVPRPRWYERLLGYRRGAGKSADEYLYDTALAKRRINEPFLRVLKGEDPDAVEAEYTKKASAEPGQRQTILFDLDGTLVDWRQNFGASDQYVLPNRIEALRELKEKGYALIGVTNRACWRPDTTPADIYQWNQETDHLLEHLLDDIVFSLLPSDAIHKPAPTMLFWAQRQYGPAVCFVGNSSDDEGAAANAGLQYYDREEFFGETVATVPAATPCACMSEPKHAWVVDGDEYAGTLPVRDVEEARKIMDVIRNNVAQAKVAEPYMVADGRVLKVRTKTAAVASWIDGYYLGQHPGAELRWYIEGGHAV